MNLSRTAIRYELSSGSAAVLVRFYLRIQLLWILIWAASDVFLVWYWTGRISGPSAHEYFGRWILAWFFIQKVPLYFLSLPYKGGRATIGSMYAYLNWRLYQGRSFGQWFASCSVWGAVPACLTLVAVYFFLRNPEDQPEGKQLRGLMLIPPRQLARELRRTDLRSERPGVEVAQVRIPRSTECEHFLITGATGAGKSMAIRSLLRQIQARGELAIVVDPECEYVSEFYRLAHGDLILNPVDERCPYWSPWLELSERYYPHERSNRSRRRASRQELSPVFEGQPHADAKQIWIVDESSLLATRQVNRLLHKARCEGVERIIFVGDQRRHHAIEAGRPIYQMQEAGMLVARLDTIRRQRDPELREAVTRASKGEIRESLAILARRGDIREVPDTEQRRKHIAAEYIAAHESGQRALVVSPANDERRALNKAIRSALVSHAHISVVGKEHTILVNRGLSGAQRAMAYNYDEGDVIRFIRGSRHFAIHKGSYGRVAGVNRDANILTVATPDGHRIEYNPTRLFGVEVFREEQRTIARGDRIQFRAPDRALAVANGEFATLRSLDTQRAVMQLDNGREVTAALDRVRHIDHGYASTSHSAQGATVDRVIVDIDTRLSPELVNREQFYVSSSRARSALTIFTDDRSRLAPVAARSREKSMALESPSVAHRGFAILPEQHRSVSREHGIRR